jgi:hypothetical protein
MKVPDGFRLESEKDRMVKTKTETFASVRTRWLAKVDNLRTTLL